MVRRRRRRRLPQQSRVRLQRQLQVQNVVDNVLQDLHFAHFLVGRDGGHQPPQAAVAVVHIALQAERRLVGRRLGRLAARCRRRGRRRRGAAQAVAVLGQAAQRQLPAAAARRRLTARGAHRAHRLHRARPARADPVGRAREAGKLQAPARDRLRSSCLCAPRARSALGAPRSSRRSRAQQLTGGSLRVLRGDLCSMGDTRPRPKGKKNQKHRKESSPPGSLVTPFGPPTRPPPLRSP